MHRLERAIALHRAHGRSANPPALCEAVELLRGVVRDAAPVGGEYVLAAASLGVVLRDLGIATQDDGLQDQAVAWMRTALAHGPAELRPTVENNLGVALRDRYDRGGDLPDLVEAVTLLRRSVGAAHPALQAQALNNLGLALCTRHRREGDLSFLDEAVLVHRQAVRTATDRDPELPRYLNDLASALRALREYRPGDELRDEAIGLHERALHALAPTAAFRRVCLHDLFTALFPCGDLDRLLDVDRDLRAFFTERDRAPDAAETNRRVMLLLRRAGHGPTLPDRLDDDLADAVDALRRAIRSVADGVPERAQLHANLADCLRLRHERRPAAVPADVVTGSYRAACREGLRAGADSAVTAAVRWAAWAERRPGADGWPEAAEAYGFALEALYRVVALQLGQERRRVRLRQLGGVPAGAALACLRAVPGRPDGGTAGRAVVLLERGRAISLSEAIDLDRARLADLAATGHRELAERFRSITGLLREREAGAGGPGRVRT